MLAEVMQANDCDETESLSAGVTSRICAVPSFEKKP